MSVRDFMHRIQERLSVQVIRHSELVREQVRRVAVCTGAGASLLGEARRAQADVYVTSDLKYNDFMTPDGAFVVAISAISRANIAQSTFCLIFYRKIYLPLRFARV